MVSSPKPLVIIPTYLTKDEDVETTMEAVRSVRNTVSDSVDIVCVDDFSPERDLLDALEPGVSRYDGEIVRKSENSGFCSPPDELILTSEHGYVRLGELDPKEHGLVSYVRSENRIVGRDWSPSRGNGGYEFQVGSRPHAGDLLGVETADGLARVTPNHGVTFQWTDKALGGWCVYLMRRGNDWRVGQTKMTHHRSCFGPWARKKNQGADNIWILSLHSTKSEALAREALLSWTYGIPSLQFKTAGRDGINQLQLNDLWREFETEVQAAALLKDHHRDSRYPFEAIIRGRANLLTTQAVNLIPGAMRIPTISGQLLPFRVDRQQYAGQVLSLEVPPHGHYISNGVVVHNSKTVNVGLQQALDDGRDAVLLNADVEITTPGWLKMMQKTADHKGRPAAVVGALLLYPTGLIQHAGIYFSLLTRTFDHMYKFGPANLKEANESFSRPVTGAFQFIRHSTLETVGLYDENFHMAHEDVDYCIRVYLAELMCMYQPRVRAFHAEMMFRGRPSEKLAEWQAKSWIYFAEKYRDQGFQGMVPFV